MATEVVMPQMGESIAEGTITRWLVKVGDKVERDQPLFEISTDKVDAEIPSPAAGTLLEIRNKENETVPVNQVVAVIGEAGEQPAAESSREAEPPGTTLGGGAGRAGSGFHRGQARGDRPRISASRRGAGSVPCAPGGLARAASGAQG